MLPRLFARPARVAGSPSRGSFGSLSGLPLSRTAPVTGPIFVAFGLLFGAVGVMVGLQEHRFATEGVVAEGRVLDKRIEHERDHRGNDSTRYVVTYRFTASSGERVDGRAFFAADAWQALYRDDPVLVRYLPDRPGTNRPADHDDVAYACALLGGGAVFTLIGGLLLGWSVRRWRRRRRLLREGVAVTARVLGVEPTPYRVGRERQWRVRYRYTDGAGVSHDAVSEPLPPRTACGWRPGIPGGADLSLTCRPWRPARS